MDTKINILEKDILYAEDQIIGHCCNTQNTMNSGVAKALRIRFPEIYQCDSAAYIKYGKELLGKCIMCDVVTDIENTHIRQIANLYGQPNYGYSGNRYMDYEAMYQSLEQLKNYVRPSLVNEIGLPYNIGCNRAGGHWPIVLEMIKHIFEGTNITINLYKI